MEVQRQDDERDGAQSTNEVRVASALRPKGPPTFRDDPASPHRFGSSVTCWTITNPYMTLTTLNSFVHRLRPSVVTSPRSEYLDVSKKSSILT